MIFKIHILNTYTIIYPYAHCNLMSNKNNTIKYPLSDDILDELDSQLDNFNETKNLGEKITIHSKLSETIENLENEINSMITLIEKEDQIYLDSDLLNNTDPQDDDYTDNLDDNIINIERHLENMKSEEILQYKLKHYQRIIRIVQKSKEKIGCTEKIMNVAKCN